MLPANFFLVTFKSHDFLILNAYIICMVSRIILWHKWQFSISFLSKLSNEMLWIFIDQMCGFHLFHMWDTSILKKTMSHFHTRTRERFQSSISSSTLYLWSCFSSGVIFVSWSCSLLSFQSFSCQCVSIGLWMGSIWKNVSVFVLRLSSKSGPFGDLTTWPPHAAPQYHQHDSLMGKIGLAKKLYAFVLQKCFTDCNILFSTATLIFFFFKYMPIFANYVVQVLSGFTTQSKHNQREHCKWPLKSKVRP